MLAFCGQDKSSLDKNGRIKFTPRVLSDFSDNGGSEIVMHCLPEGAIAIYPEEVFVRMRRQDGNKTDSMGSNLLSRRSLRRFGALSKSEKISAQGRLTLPATYREYASLSSDSEIVVVGNEVGVEIWSKAKWETELELINEHIKEKSEQEIASDLTT